jgi:hypothetical protein
MKLKSRRTLILSSLAIFYVFFLRNLTAVLDTTDASEGGLASTRSTAGGKVSVAAHAGEGVEAGSGARVHDAVVSPELRRLRATLTDVQSNSLNKTLSKSDAKDLLQMVRSNPD